MLDFYNGIRFNDVFKKLKFVQRYEILIGSYATTSRNIAIWYKIRF